MANQQDVEIENLPSRHPLRQFFVGLLRAGLRADQSQSPADAVHVCVDRQHRLAAGEQKPACSRLGSHTRETPQVRGRLCIGHRAEEAKRQRAMAAVYLLEEGLDARCLLSSESTVPDHSDNRRDPCSTHIVPAGKLLTQRGKCGVTVLVRRVLREDRRDEFVKHRKLCGRTDRTMDSTKPATDRRNGQATGGRSPDSIADHGCTGYYGECRVPKDEFRMSDPGDLQRGHKLPFGWAHGRSRLGRLSSPELATKSTRTMSLPALRRAFSSGSIPPPVTSTSTVSTRTTTAWAAA